MSASCGAAGAFGQAPGQHRHGGLDVARQADGLEVVQPVRGIGEVADLDRGAERILQRRALQFERQRAERALDGAEGVARLRPFAVPGERQRPPQRRVVLVADHRVGEVLLRLIDAAEHDVGGGAQHQRRRILGGRAVVGDRGVEHGLGLGIELPRQIEPREIEPRARCGR